MSRHPLFVLAIIFSLGIFFASRITIPLPVLYAGAIIFLALAVCGRGFVISSFCLVLVLGMLCFNNANYLPPCHIQGLFSYADNSPYIVQGFILDEPQFKSNKTIFLLEATRLQDDNLNRSCCGKVLVNVKGKADLDYGDELILQGELSHVLNIGESSRSYLRFLRNQGIYVQMQVKNCAYLANTGKNNGFFLKRFSLRCKQKIEKVFYKQLSCLSAAVLDAMVLGEKANIPKPVYNSMIKSGTVHILVVSGFNVGIVIFILVLSLRLARIPRKPRIYIAIPMLVIYCLMTGASSVTRFPSTFVITRSYRRSPICTLSPQ